MVTLKIPTVQIALDFATTEEAIAMAHIGVEAGVDPLGDLATFVREVKARYRPRRTGEVR